MLVVATAGHVDHGKSTLVRALTGMEPDRLAEEHRRGLTIELGYAWTTLTPPGAELTPPGAEPVQVAFVDVPGHQRFIGTMLAGLGPVSAVVLVVAADAGWSAQTTEHLDAIHALGIDRGVVAVTRSDLADPTAVAADVRRRLSSTSLGNSPTLAVSARTGSGLGTLRSTLADLAQRVPVPGATTSLWADRAFTRPGSGTVITGTLTGGHVSSSEQVWLTGPAGSVSVTVRRLQSLGRDQDTVTAPARVAVNLRGLPLDPRLRGSRLTGRPLTPTTVADVRVTAGDPLPRTARLHVGTTVRSATIRPLSGDLFRLTWAEPLPLLPGDRGLLRDPARHLVLGGLEVLDPNPPRLRRRGDAGRRAAELTGASGIRRHGDLLIEDEAWQRWGQALRTAVATGPVPVPRALELCGMPHAELLPELARSVGLAVHGDLIGEPTPPWEAPLRNLEAAWSRTPFRSPTQQEVAAAGLTPGALNSAAAAGRVLRLPGGLLLPGDASSRAVQILAVLPQPFRTSQAREALDTTRRIAVPLLEHLDRLGLTSRIDASLRRVVRRVPHPDPESGSPLP